MICRGTVLSTEDLWRHIELNTLRRNACRHFCGEHEPVWVPRKKCPLPGLRHTPLQQIMYITLTNVWYTAGVIIAGGRSIKTSWEYLGLKNPEFQEHHKLTNPRQHHQLRSSRGCSRIILIMSDSVRQHMYQLSNKRGNLGCMF